MKETLEICLYLLGCLLIVALLLSLYFIALPAAIFWACNTLFGTCIPMSLKTFFAADIILFVFGITLRRGG